MRYLLPLLALAAGCIKQPEVVRSPEPADVAVAVVLDQLDEREVAGGGDALLAEIDAALTARGLTPSPVSEASLADAFSASRATDRRVAWLAENQQDPMLLLVEASPDFISQLGGRFRWTVDVTVTVAPRSDVDAGISRQFDVPVFLSFYHEQAPEALEAAAPVIGQRLGGALDEFLGGLE